MKRRISLTLVLVSLAFPQLAAAQIQSVPLEHPDEIVTEEIHAQTYINYLALPETTEAVTSLDVQQLRYKSEIELAAELSRLEADTAGCISLRGDLEAEIGDGPGSWFVNPAWVKLYQNCVLQNRRDLRSFGVFLEQRLANIISTGGEEGATLQTELIDRLRAKHSAATRVIDQELRTQRKFVSYYNTGERNY